MAHAYEYAINRYYTPQAASFLSVDPLVAQTQQPYAFTGGNPLNATDPLGLAYYYNYLHLSGHSHTWIWGTETTPNTSVERIYGGECMPGAIHCGGPGCHHSVCVGEFLRYLSTHSAVRTYMAALSKGPAAAAVEEYTHSGTFTSPRTTVGHDLGSAVSNGVGDIASAASTVVHSVKTYYASRNATYAQNPILGPLVKHATPAAAFACVQSSAGDFSAGVYFGYGIWYVSQYVPGVDIGVDTATVGAGVVSAGLGCSVTGAHLSTTSVGG